MKPAGSTYVAVSAVIARYSPFAEKAGMQKIAEQHPRRAFLMPQKHSPN
jgi:hypothetical protein